MYHFRAMLSIGQSILTDETAEELISGLFGAAGLNDKCALTLSDFKLIFSDLLFKNISIDWKGKTYGIV